MNPRQDVRLLTKADEITDHILVLVANTVEDWFPDENYPLGTEALIDKLCEHHGHQEGWDIENLDTPAVRKIMRHARATRAEMT